MSNKRVSKIQLNQFIALKEGRAKCKHCRKPMANSWWKKCGGYCYDCSRNHFTFLREKACVIIINALKRLI